MEALALEMEMALALPLRVSKLRLNAIRTQLQDNQNANMYYADLYPDPLKDEASCLRAAYKVANDPDGYDGMIFCRWTADAIGKAIKLDWEKFV